MSFRWPTKDPDETLDYSIDWSRFLGSGVTIAATSWFVESKSYPTKTELADGQDLNTATDGATTDSIQNVSSTFTNTVATINIGSGQHNEEYTFYCQIIDSTGSLAERTIKLRVKDQ